MHDINKITKSDKLLAATFLKLLPERVTPNQITMFRIFTVPFVALLFWLELYKYGVILFAVSAFTDALDGALARTKRMITDWGSMYDPLADKLLIGITAFVVLPQYVGPWIVFSMIFLEMLLIGMAYYYRTQEKRMIISANWWGKSKMICQSIGVFMVLIYILWPLAIILTIAEVILYLAIGLSVISLITYSL